MNFFCVNCHKSIKDEPNKFLNAVLEEKQIKKFEEMSISALSFIDSSRNDDTLASEAKKNAI